MLDRISNEPFGFVSALLIWLPLALWVISIVHWMVQDEIDLITGIIGLGVALGLIVLTASPPDKRLPPIIFICVVATVILFPVVRQSMVRRALTGIDTELVERAYNMLRDRPTNVGSEVKIASVLFDRGYPGHAIAIVERVLANMPKGVMEEEQRMVIRWRMRTPAHYLDAALGCLQCGFPNKPGPIYCTRCGAPFLLEQLKGKWITGGLSARLLVAWVTCVAAIVGVALAGMKLPTAIAPIVMGAIGVGVVIVMWYALRRQEAKG